MSLKLVEIFCDGACVPNPGKGGWAALLRYTDEQNRVAEKITHGFDEYTTNNRMELEACINALETLKEPCVVTVFSDSTYLVNGATRWLWNWADKDFHNIKNPEHWKRIHELHHVHVLSFTWIKSHSDHPENELVDRIAYKCALRKYKAPTEENPNGQNSPTIPRACEANTNLEHR